MAESKHKHKSHHPSGAGFKHKPAWLDRAMDDEGPAPEGAPSPDMNGPGMGGPPAGITPDEGGGI